MLANQKVFARGGSDEGGRRLVSRMIMVRFRRDAMRDRRREDWPVAGYRMLWPVGREVDVDLEAFCRYGERLLGLDRHLAGASDGSWNGVDLTACPAAESLADRIRTEEGLHS